MLSICDITKYYFFLKDIFENESICEMCELFLTIITFYRVSVTKGKRSHQRKMLTNKLKNSTPK